jgi:hypothetical protein
MLPAEDSQGNPQEEHLEVARTLDDILDRLVAVTVHPTVKCESVARYSYYEKFA